MKYKQFKHQKLADKVICIFHFFIIPYSHTLVFGVIWLGNLEQDDEVANYMQVPLDIIITL